jgi:general secretion pathway protein G
MHSPRWLTLLLVNAVLLLIAVAWGSANLHRGCRIDSRVAKLSALGAKIELFALDTGQLPHTLNDLLVRSGTEWHGPYARPNDLLDIWGRPYQYRRYGFDVEFELITLGSDAAPGGEGDARDMSNADYRDSLPLKTQSP